MQHEITITVYNPTTNPNNWAADVYCKSFDPSKQDGEAGCQSDTRNKRIQCGRGGLTTQEALLDATRFIQGFVHVDDNRVTVS